MTPRLEAQLPQGLPVALRHLTAPCYLHRTPQWIVTGVLTLALVLVATGLGYVCLQLLEGELSFTDIVLAAFLLLFLAPLLRPAIWRSPIVMAADAQGIHLVGVKESLLIPWRETGHLAIERVRSASGTVASVVATVSKAFASQQAAVAGSVGLGAFSPGPPGFIRLPFSNPGIDPRVTKASLEALRQLSGDPRHLGNIEPATGSRRWELVVAGTFFLGLAAFIGVAMLRAVWVDHSDPHVGLLIPAAMFAFAVFVIRAGWQRMP